MPIKTVYLTLILPFLVLGCIIPGAQKRTESAQQMVNKAGWQESFIEAGSFKLTAFTPKEIKPSATLRVYIEGDGMAWISSDKSSSNPTPNNPIALKMALADKEGEVAYLARPYQYLDVKDADYKWWTSHRFAPEVITATNIALDILKAKHHASKLELFGYSGGGAIAALAAAKRQDVTLLVTFAGNLDTEKWVELHHLSPLYGSLNPAYYTHNLEELKQVHFVGADDENIPPAIAESYAARFNKRPKIVIIENYNHQSFGETKWLSTMANHLGRI